MTENLIAKQKTLTGIGFDGHVNKVVFATPIASVYSAFRDFALEEVLSGWWQTAICDKWICVLVPQGTPSLDLLHAIPVEWRYIHVGYAGATQLGFEHGLDFGSIVGVNYAACYPSNIPVEAGLVFSGLIQCSFFSVPNFFVSEKSQKTFGMEYDCFDMECGFVLDVAKREGKLAGCVQMISDSIDNPWYATQPMGRREAEGLSEAALKCIV